MPPQRHAPCDLERRHQLRPRGHPLAYASFEGRIPPKQYGASLVIVWDRGHWQPDGDPHLGLAQGKLVFSLQGHKLHGHWELVRLHKPGERQQSWLLFKKRDAAARARADDDVLVAQPGSVLQAGAAAAGAEAKAPAVASPAGAVRPAARQAGPPGRHRRRWLA